MLRWLTSLVSSRTVRSASLSCLRSGHSHEDIDQHFGRLSQFLLRWKTLQSPDDTVACVRAFLDQGKFFEKERVVVAMNRTRDWKGFHTAAVPIAVMGMTGPGAPHHFLLQRRADAGLGNDQIDDSYWKKAGEHCDDVLLRTKRWLHSEHFSFNILFYPKEVAMQLLPLGLPAGLAENKSLAQDLVDHVKKYLPLLRNPIFKLERAADWLEGWIGGTLQDYPLLDISALKAPEKKLALVKSYTKRAKVRIVHRAAASAWMQGVPWAEALDIASKALAAADGIPRTLALSRKGRGKGKAKGKGPAIAKGKGRSK
ncbi:unnamed protein product [Durusdinium trenchii]|uniref:DUF7869 domain-containing protein n=1 Tax=Durusdinium trenchii TaxID=1381693 RepID=A0ABP0K9F9_9DINO